MSFIEFWKEHCRQAFSGDTKSNDFILFVEGCKTLSENGLEYTWKTTEYENEFKMLGCQQVGTDTFSLSLSDYKTLANLKSDIRSQWHVERQQQLQQHLKATLNNVDTLSMSSEQRLLYIRQFIKDHETDLGAVPFIRGLAGFLCYQLQHKTHLVEWRLSEYVLSQNNEEAMESYIRLLKGVLGLQLIYQDDENNNKDTVIDMKQDETIYSWRMNSELNNSFIQQALKSFSKHASNNTLEYRITEIPRDNNSESLLYWFYDLISQCLSFFHK